MKVLVYWNVLHPSMATHLPRYAFKFGPTCEALTPFWRQMLKLHKEGAEDIKLSHSEAAQMLWVWVKCDK